MKFLPFLFLIISLAPGCKDDPSPESTCGVGNPAKDLYWLAAEINQMDTSSLSKYQYVQQAQYNSQTVFIFGNCCPFCDSIFPVYNCSGDRIGYLGNGPDGVNSSNLTDWKLIWSSKNSVCSFSN